MNREQITPEIMKDKLWEKFRNYALENSICSTARQFYGAMAMLDWMMDEMALHKNRAILKILEATDAETK